MRAEPFAQVGRRDFAAVGLPAQIAIGREAVSGAIGEEPAFDAGIGPIEAVDADRLFTRRQAERHGDEEAALEGADFDQRAADAECRLAPEQVSANGGREARGHAAHAFVALRQVAVDGGMAARDLDHGSATFAISGKAGYVPTSLTPSSPRETETSSSPA